MTKEKKIGVMLVDDHLVVRMGLSAIISIEKDMTVVAEAEDGVEAVELAKTKKPDVIVMDLSMPKLDGAQATIEILAASPEAKIMVLTTFGGADGVKRAMDAGAISALVKDTSQKDLIEAIRLTAQGTPVVCPEIQHMLATAPPDAKLSERQLTILEYVAKGFNNREIADLLDVSPDCVKAHLKIVFARLGVASRSEAAALAVSRKMISV